MKRPATERSEQFKSVRIGIILFFGALIGFAAYDAFCKHMLATYPAPLMNLTRYTAVVTIAAFWLIRSTRQGVDWRLWRSPHRALLMWRSVMLSIVATCFMAALIWMPLAEATAIYFTAPLIMVAVSPWLLGERVGRVQWAAVITGFFGMLLIVRPGADLPLLGTVLMAISAVCYALFQVLTRRLSGLVPSPIQYSYMALTCLVITGVPALFMLPEVMPPFSDLALLLAAGAGSGLAQFLLLGAFKRVQASVLAPLNYVQLLLAVLISAFWFDRIPDAIAMAGILLITACGAFLALRRAQPKS